MIVLGLTGSIGMGKSTAASMLRRLGCPVHDADAAVHRLYARGGAAVPRIAALFPEAIRDGAVDRARLSALILGDPAALKRLEAVVHPLVRKAADDFLRRSARRGVAVAVLDIPLLFETGGQDRVDRVVVVSAPAFVQRRRVLARPGMTADKLALILARQMPDREKRRRADFVVPTGLGRRYSLQCLAAIVRLLRSQRGRVWPPVAARPRTARFPAPRRTSSSHA
ncbi:dephospho-CoA kinase [Oleisolibacter albus]|uniref:dephospho-CoA kinase n=1 Tax=Oleisolibacter albus TaxID=2171757 RepID=UPI000DF3AEF5|nr:dephospho-CoA kinase [Oleisolibacter albus]